MLLQNEGLGWPNLEDIIHWKTMRDDLERVGITLNELPGKCTCLSG